MTQYRAIPQPQDQRNISQGDILNNFNYLCTGLGSGATPGILPVDHFATADNGANPTDGFHQQVSFKNKSPVPSSMTANPVNGQTPDCYLYSFTDGTRTELAFLTTTRNIKLTAKSNPSPASLGQSFFPSLVGSNDILVQWGFEAQPVSSPTTVNFSTAFSSNPWNIQVTCTRNGGGSPGDNETYVDISTLSPTSVKVITAHTVGFYWMAIGPK